MKKICKSIMAVFFAAVLLVTLPGVYVLADELQEDFYINELYEEAADPDDMSAASQQDNQNFPEDVYNSTLPADDPFQISMQGIEDSQSDNVDETILFDEAEDISLTEDDIEDSLAGALESTGNSTLDSFINDSRFTNGASWAYNKTPMLASFSSWGCCAYCADYVKYCYGINNPRQGTSFTNVNEIRQGDVLTVGNQSDGTGHWFVCLKRNGNSLYVAEGNYSNRVRIGWNYTISGNKFAQDSRSFTAGYHFLSPTPVEYKAPDIKNAHITNATTASYEVRFNAYDDSGIVFAQVGCWSDKWDIDKAKWYTVPFSNNYGAITISVSDMGGYKDCWYYCNIYVVDEFGNKSEATTVKVFIDGTAPQIKNAHITNTTTTSYEVRFNAYDDSDITFAQVGCWSDKWDIDKAKWYTVPFSNNYGAITIPISDMGGYKDCWYYCNIYTLDAFGNRSNATTVKVYICDTNSTNHNWGDPIWKWTGNDANGYSAATATVTCKTDKSHKMTFKATVTKKASGTGKNAKMTYTATATISGKKFTTTKTVAIKMALVSSVSVGKLKTIKLTPVLTPKDTPVEAYTWKSSKPAAAKVNSSGTVTGVNLGQTDITATCSKYGLSAKCTVNVWFNDVMPKDVPDGITKENYQYIYWGVKNGIINGYADGSFKPNNPVTRAQFCIMIWKLAGKPAPSSKAASFKDISSLTANGQKAIKWAQEKGLVNGFGNGIFKPNDVLTRCQIMIILWKWSGRPAYGNMAKYSDISALTLNTQKAISWGVNNRIISASGNKFTPNGNVSRADFLNILYQFNKVSYKKIPSNLDAVPKQ